MRDSKLEKQNHEATPKHQGNLQRFLRELHRNNERDTREQQRGKDEVARLKGITNDTTDSANVPGRQPAIAASSNNRQATAADRKRQLQQLAEMGIAVPEEARREMAMAGDWHIQSVTPIYEKNEVERNGEDEGVDSKTDALAVGVHKRKFEGDEEKEEAGEKVVKRGWGSTTRTWQNDDNADLDALLEATKAIKKDQDEPPADTRSERKPITVQTGTQACTEHHENLDGVIVKREEEDAITKDALMNAIVATPTDVAIGPAVTAEEPSILFKKRKSKQTRQN